MIRLSKNQRKALVSAAAFFHLALLATGMTHVWDLSTDPNLGFARNAYETVTGATGGFGFFSPSVGQQLVLNLHLRDQDGNQKTMHLEDFVSPEASVRVGNMVRFLAYSYKDEKLRRSIAASFAAFAFSHFPETTEVAIEGVAFRFPALEDYAKGERTEQETVYRIKFKKRKTSGIKYAEQTQATTR